MLLDPREIPIVPSPSTAFVLAVGTRQSHFHLTKGESNSDDVARAIINESLSFRSGSRPGPSSRNKTINDFYLYSSVWLVSWGGGRGRAPGPRTKSPVNYVRS